MQRHPLYTRIYMYIYIYASTSHCSNYNAESSYTPTHRVYNIYIYNNKLQSHLFINAVLYRPVLSYKYSGHYQLIRQAAPSQYIHQCTHSENTHNARLDPSVHVTMCNIKGLALGKESSGRDCTTRGCYCGSGGSCQLEDLGERRKRKFQKNSIAMKQIRKVSMIDSNKPPHLERATAGGGGGGGGGGESKTQGCGGGGGGGGG